MNDDNKKGACAPFLLQRRKEYACRRGPHEMGFLPKRLTSATASLLEAKGDLQPRQDSNLDQAFRKRLFYPLNYGAVLRDGRRTASRGRKDATHL